MAVAAGTGSKRPQRDGDEHEVHERERRDRPRDWREAFLNDKSPRGGGSRERERDYGRDYDREREYGRDRGNYRDRDRDREREHRRDGADRDRRRDYDRRDGERDRDRDRERERQRGFPQRTRDRRDDRAGSREDGEIESPPRGSPRGKNGVASPRRPSPSRSSNYSHSRSHPSHSSLAPDRSNDRDRDRSRDRSRDRGHSRDRSHDRMSARAAFKPVTIPKTDTPQTTRPPAGFERPPPAAVDEPDVEEEDDEDIEKKLAEKRRRREAIMAKYLAGEGPKPPLPVSATASTVASPSAAAKDLPGSGAESIVSNGLNTDTGTTPLFKQLGTRSITTTAAGTPTGHEPSLAHTPMGHDFDLEKHGAAAPASDGNEGVSAAEYDASKAGDNEKARKEENQLPKAEPKPKVADEDEWEEVEIEVEEEDDDVDMFAAFGGEEPVKRKRKVKVRRRKAGNGEVVEIQKPVSNVAAALDVVDNVDDTEGYYRITPGEVLDDGRYQVTVTLGKGMFSAVIRAKVLKAVGQERRQDVVGKEVAIKVMRSQESMYVAGRKEAQILKLLNDADPEDKKHIVRMERTFEHKGHLCIVTESMSMNLRDVIKRFGKDVGLNMRAVRAYAHQMLLALSLMRKCNIVHADIKPDNVLVSENKAVLKVCDLGTAAEVSEGDITPYLVSRFYRAPEIILGLPYDTAIDIWAIGCTLFELFTGKILFPGRSNNHMLLLMMETKGKLPHRLIKKAKASLGAMHFDENNNFISVEKDRITGADVVKTTVITRATRDLRSRLMPSSGVQAKMPEGELKQLQQFVDLLEKCLALDPVRRISSREALLHPFVTGV